MGDSIRLNLIAARKESTKPLIRLYQRKTVYIIFLKMHKIAKITGSFLRGKKIVKSNAGFGPVKVDALKHFSKKVLLGEEF